MMSVPSVCQQVWLSFLFLSSINLSRVLAQIAESSASASPTTFATLPSESVGFLATTTVTKATHTVVTIHGKTNTLPVLPDHDHGCYFCPTGPGGFVLSGFTQPGVYPSHTVSGFPLPFPEITVGSPGDPSFRTQLRNTTSRSGHNGTASTTQSDSRSSDPTGAPKSIQSVANNGTSIQTHSRTPINLISTTHTSAPSSVHGTTSRSLQKINQTSLHDSTRSTFLGSVQISARSSADTQIHSSSSSRSGTTARTSTQSSGGNGTQTIIESNDQTSTHTSTGITTHSSIDGTTQGNTGTTTTHDSTNTMTHGNTGTGTQSTTSLSSITIFPTETPKTITGTTVTSNGKTTESSSGHTTVLPVLPTYGKGSGLCWFCPPSFGGFILSGFLNPGIYPTGNLPGFPDIIPPITIGPDLIPTFSPEPSDNPTTNQQTTNSEHITTTESDQTTTTPSSICSASTVSNCKVVTSFSVSGSTTETKVVTSCAAQTACSAYGTTTASATTTTATGCWKYDYSLALGNPSSDDSAAKRDDLDANGNRVHWLRRRGKAKEVKKYGACQIVTAAGASALTIPAYPNAQTLENYQAASWWYIPTTTQVAGQNCPIVTMTQFQNLAALTAAPVMNSIIGAGATYAVTQVGGRNAPPYVDVDHVYELSLMKSFLEEMLGSNAVSCQDFNNFFMAVDSNSQEYRLQVILNQLPSEQFPDFAGMDHNINDLKGKMFNAGLKDLPKRNKPAEVIQLANELAAANDLVNSGDIAKLFKNTNSRIYNAWKGVDDLIAGSCGGVGPKPNGGKWADAYSAWITDFVQSRNVDITVAIDSLISTDGASPPQLTDGVKAFENKYSRASWGWNAAVLFDWTVSSPLAINKRDDVCLVTNTATTKSAPATTTADPSHTESSTGKTVTTQISEKTTLTTARTSITSTSVSTTSAQTPTNITSFSTSSTKALIESTPASTNNTQIPTKSTPTSTTSTQSSTQDTSSPTTTSNPPPTSTFPASTSSQAQSSVKACTGNQIAGPCTQDSLPTTAPDSGSLPPVCYKVDSPGSPYVRFNDTQAHVAANTYCNNLISGNTVLTAGSAGLKPGMVSGACEKNGILSLVVIFDVDSCDPGTSTADQKVDFAAMGVDACVQNLYFLGADVCAQDHTWGDYNPEYTLEGGVLGTKCALWAMFGEAA